MTTTRGPDARPVVYPELTTTLRRRTVEALADDELNGNLRTAAASWATGRRRVGTDYPFAEMRERAREIRRGNIRTCPRCSTAWRSGCARPGAW